ncbi:MAG: guanylate kinase [Candidatus Lindowbacteria bacterium]|nr:guanylate kinase [Candidatus Lindowbacteria bacterium]
MSVRGSIFIISAPSGTGKSTLTRRILKKVPRITYSISSTTRPIRRDETNGVEYNFKDKATFQKMIEEGLFLEHAEVHGNYYGTEKASVNQILDSGSDVLFDIDIQGANQIKIAHPESVSIFIMPPSLAVLEERLRRRGTEDESTIIERLQAAESEMANSKEYDYVVVNEDLDSANGKIEEIIEIERKRVSST